jgi:16S rRNA (guanine1207-N2)-methyltransferase
MMVRFKNIIRDRVSKAVKKSTEPKKDNQEHYYAPDPTSEARISTIEYEHDGVKFTFTASSGVFGKKKVDKGTDLLINNIPDISSKKVLDLGCGIGIVGIVAARKYPSAIVSASDVNKRAVMLAKSNAKQNNVKIKAYHSDGFNNIKESFDYILLNPPQSAGKDICIRLIRESFENTKDNGAMLLVARKNKGGKSLSECMQQAFGNVKSIAIKAGYHVYMSVRR